MDIREKEQSAQTVRELKTRPLRMQTMAELDTAPSEEVIEKRNPFAKTYSLGENMYQAVVYGTPVHYRDKATGEWREIDNTLVAGKTKRGSPCLVNRANGELKATLCALAEEPLVSLETERGDTLSWSLEEVKADGKVMQATGALKDWSPTLEAVAKETGHVPHARRERVLAQNSGEGVFTNVLPETDMRCHVDGTTFKDELIFRTRASAKAVSFLLRAPGLELSLREDQSIQALRSDGENAFYLPAPFMVDADGKEGKVSVALEATGDGSHRLTYVPEEAWLDGARFPVAVDPTVITDRTNASAFVYKCVASSGSVTNYELSNDTVRRVCYMKFDSAYLPTIEASSYIGKALLYAAPQSTGSLSKDRVVYLREVLSSWTTSMTYSTQPNVSGSDTDIAIAPANNLGYQEDFYFDVSNLVRKWYSGTNYGVVLDIRDKLLLAGNVGISTYETTKPYIVLNYMSYAGLIDHLAYESHSAGRAGTAHINLLTGNLVFEHADTAGNGNRMPVSVTHYYNTCDGTNDLYKMGTRWKTSLHQTLYYTSIKDYSETSKTYFVYTDASGRQHHFRPDSNATYNIEAEDQSGLSLKLKVTSAEATIRDKYDNVLTFDRPMYQYQGTGATLEKYVCPLKSITNAQGDVIAIAAAAVAKTIDITGATDGAGRKTTFTTTGSRISAIKGPGEANGAKFTYDASGRLTKITHEDNAQTTYGYNSSGYLTSVTNHDGRKLTIAYTGAKVKSVSESNGDVTGNSREYTYAANMTTVTDKTVPDGKKLFYHFDDYGNVTSVSDELGYAALARYNDDQPPYKPEMLSKLQRSVVNLLQNHSFDTDTGWAHEGGQDLANEESAYSTHCLRFTDNAYQTVALTPGKTYTLSYYAKRSGGLGVRVLYGYTDAGGQKQRVELPGVSEEITGRYSRFAHSFALPEDISGNEVTLHFESVGGTSLSSVVCIDFVQLEEGPIANRYNMLLNGDFSLNTDDVPLHWTPGSGNNSQDKALASADAAKPAGLTPNVLRINGEPGKEKGVYQEIPVSGKKDEVFVAGGWARGYTRPRKGKDKLYGIRVSFKTSGNAYTDTKSVEWEEEWTAWTFACGPVIAPKDFTSIRFHVDYHDNVNYADFAGLFLHREGFGRTFAYDSKGNVLSVQNLAGQKNQAVYDSFNNLTSYRPWGQPETVKVTMNYGATDAQRQKHLLLKSTSPTGIVQEYTYDASGNATSAKVSAAGTAAFMKTTTAYTANRNYVASLTDSRGKTVSSQIDATKGTLTSVTDPMGQTVSYAYDSLKRMTSATAVVDGKTYRNEYAYTRDKLTQTKHNTDSDTECDVVYNFEHDELGNLTVSKVGAQPLSTTVYTETGDRLPVRVEYGNGGKLHYDRDEFKRVMAVRYDNETTPRYEYAFDASENPARVVDNHLGRTVTHEYDLSNRPMRTTTCAGDTRLYRVEAAYDECNRIMSVKELVGNGPVEMVTDYTYDTENRPTRVEFGEQAKAHTIAYDELDRVAGRTRTVGGNSYTTSYAYLTGGQGTNSTTTIVETMTQPGETYGYTYDDVGWITSMTRNGETVGYAYDSIGQLVRADDPRQGLSFSYAYDRGGNLLSKSEHAYTTGALGGAVNTVSYTYGDSNWKDKLTAYNGIGITHDEIGNPLNDGTWTYAWQTGRRLQSMSKTGENVTFAYNADGFRIRKESTSRGATEYILHGKRVSHLKRGQVEMHFWYAMQERPTMTTYNGEDYLYVYNGQGDVVALVHPATQEAVVRYGYDAWGKQIHCLGTLADTLGRDNPFRYRGYMYDEETGWYYLRSRYYNPEWGRWINADALVTKNLFAYCNNNPVNMCDPTGFDAVGIYEQKWLSDTYGKGASGDARIYLPNGGGVIEGSISQTPPYYHFDLFPSSMDTMRLLKKAAGGGYSWDPLSIIFEVDYPEDMGGTITMYAVVRPFPHVMVGTGQYNEKGVEIKKSQLKDHYGDDVPAGTPQLCVSVLDSSTSHYDGHKSKGIYNDVIKNAANPYIYKSSGSPVPMCAHGRSSSLCDICS